MITRNEAKEKMYQHLYSDYDLTRSEAKDSFEMQLIDEIYDAVEYPLEYPKLCDNCQHDYACSIQDTLAKEAPIEFFINFGCTKHELRKTNG